MSFVYVFSGSALPGRVDRETIVVSLFYRLLSDFLFVVFSSSDWSSRACRWQTWCDARLCRVLFFVWWSIRCCGSRYEAYVCCVCLYVFVCGYLSVVFWKLCLYTCTCIYLWCAFALVWRAFLRVWSFTHCCVSRYEACVLCVSVCVCCVFVCGLVYFVIYLCMRARVFMIWVLFALHWLKPVSNSMMRHTHKQAHVHMPASIVTGAFYHTQ